MQKLNCKKHKNNLSFFIWVGTFFYEVHNHVKFPSLYSNWFVRSFWGDKGNAGGIICLFWGGYVLSCLYNPQFVPDLSKRFSKFCKPFKWTQAEFTKYRLTVKLIVSLSCMGSLLFCSKPYKTHDYGWVLLRVFGFAWTQKLKVELSECVNPH